MLIEKNGDLTRDDYLEMLFTVCVHKIPPDSRPFMDRLIRIAYKLKNLSDENRKMMFNREIFRIHCAILDDMHNDPKGTYDFKTIGMINKNKTVIFELSKSMDQLLEHTRKLLKKQKMLKGLRKLKPHELYDRFA